MRENLEIIIPLVLVAVAVVAVPVTVNHFVQKQQQRMFDAAKRYSNSQNVSCEFGNGSATCAVDRNGQAIQFICVLDQRCYGL